MARLSQPLRFFDLAALPIGQQWKIATVKQAVDVGLQWQNHHASGDTLITLYGTTEPDLNRLAPGGVMVSPVGNAYWSVLPIQFYIQPSAVIGSLLLPIAADPHTFIAAHFNTSIAHESFSFTVNVKTE